MRKIADKDWPKCCICGERKDVCIDGKYYCNKHYQSMKKYGHPFGEKRKSTNSFKVIGDVLTIVTKNGDVFLADVEDKEKLEKYSWCLSKTGYAVANINHKVTKMHRYILGVKDQKVVVDHKNRDTCDNRKDNLRICTCADNARNKTVSRNCKSGYIGIRLTDHGKYNVRITFDRQEIHIGNFETLDLAIAARKEAEKRYHGEFGSNQE